MSPVAARGFGTEIGVDRSARERGIRRRRHSMIRSRYGAQLKSDVVLSVVQVDRDLAIMVVRM